jgi:hypothetical protein
MESMIMRRSPVVFQQLILLLASVSLVSAQTSAWVFIGPDGHLQYQTDSQGNRIMDFSFAGYKGGGVSLPNLAVQQMVSPSGADDTAAIQGAIDAVSALTPDTNGFRGGVLLTPGTFNCSGALSIRTSGVVLRGSGSDPSGTIINMTGNPHTAFTVAGTGSYQTTGSSAAMTDSYVPSGAMSFNVDNPSGFNVGDTILVRRPVTTAWIHFMGMDLLVRSGQPQTWISAGSTITTDRIITAVNGNQITLDAPLTDSFDSSFLNPPGGTIIHYTFTGRISQVGVEHLSVIAPALNVDISQPQFTGLNMGAVMDGWVQDLVFQDTQNTVTISGNVKQATLESINVTHTVNHTGDRMADFGVSGTQIFIDQSSSTGNPGEWPFVTQGRVTGPNVLLNFYSTQQAGISAHQRWATGLLADNAQLPNAPNGYDGGTTGISYSDRGNHGSGQGWAMGWGVAWNVTTPWLVVQMPPGSQNWCIGCVGTPISGNEPGSTRPVPDGIYDSLGTLVTPPSLYLAQLCERLGPMALTNIGYDSSFCASQGGFGPIDGATEIFPSYTVQNRTNRPLDQVYGTYIDPNDGTTLVTWTNVCAGEQRTELRWQTWANQDVTNIEDYDMMFDSDTQRTAVSQIKSNTGGEAVYLQVTDPGIIRQDNEHHSLVEGIDGQWHHWTILYNPATGYGEIWYDYSMLESVQHSLGSFDWYFKNGTYNNGLPDGHCSTAYFENFRHFYTSSYPSSSALGATTQIGEKPPTTLRH